MINHAEHVINIIKHFKRCACDFRILMTIFVEVTAHVDLGSVPTIPSMFMLELT